jgi:putative transposase
MPRLPRVDGLGLLYHVMARGIERRPIFRNDGDRNNFLQRLKSILAETATCCYAWSLLPDHFHLLLQTGGMSLSTVMRRLMTGYAVTFNRRYKRNGHLFQNRYKSIVCEKEPYLVELIRYIHLNPIRVGLVRSLFELDQYPWSGHSALMGSHQRDWQEVDGVLQCFSDRRGRARLRYRRFVEDGKDHGRRADLIGERRNNSEAQEIYDERVLGGRDFVEKVLKTPATGNAKKRPRIPLPDLIRKVSQCLKVEREELLLGRRKKEICEARALVAYLATQKMGYRFSEVGQALNIHPVNAARSLEKGKKAFLSGKGLFDKLI